jgi:hypothetical protein
LLQVVGIIADVTVNNCTWLSRKAVMDEIFDGIAIKIQRGNADMVHAGQLQHPIATRYLSY